MKRGRGGILSDGCGGSANLGQSEVQNFHLPGASKEEIRRLDVSVLMDDANGVCRFERAQHASRDFRQLPGRHLAE